MIYISIVVDCLIEHYYKADLLLSSLVKLGNYSKKNIIVNCIEGVDQQFIEYLENKNFKYRYIKPIIDKKYCNKINQLNSLKQYLPNAKGVILLDLDIIVLGKFHIEKMNQVYGKIVDGPNPDLKIIKLIYKKANVDLPELVDVDWTEHNDKILSNYFNGGFYYIPIEYIEDLYNEWLNKASWLNQIKISEISDDKWKTHIDQISMSLSLTNLAIPNQRVDSNYNLPIHLNCKLRYYNKKKEIIALHYHNILNDFGFIEKNMRKEKKILAAIKAANRFIAINRSQNQYIRYKEEISRSCCDKTDVIGQELQKKLNPKLKKVKIIIHAGTPKTATTSIQFYLARNRKILKAQGFLYPNLFSDTYSPKHQWIVSDLLEKNWVDLVEKLNKICEEIDNKTHTVVLSSEGLYNHWFDFQDVSRSFLKTLSTFLNVHLIISFREPKVFIDRLYRQYLKNPYYKSNQCYGRNLKFEEMIEIKWFNKHLDYLGFIFEVERIFSQNKINIIPFNSDMIESFNKIIGLNQIIKNIDFIKNRALSNFSVYILRVINTLRLRNFLKKIVVKLIYIIDLILKSVGLYSIKLIESEEDYTEFSRIDLNYIYKKYQSNMSPINET